MYKAIICILVISQVYNTESTDFDVLARARKAREPRLQSCDAKKNDMCDRSSKQLFTESKKGECAKKACVYTPKNGVTQDPRSMYFRYKPNAIKSSTKKILHSFKEIKGEICAIKNQPCSCRNEAKCSCESESARFCKQQYRVERSYFVVFNKDAAASPENTYGHMQTASPTQQYYPSSFDQSDYFQPSARSGEIKRVAERRNFNLGGMGFRAPMRSASQTDSDSMQQMIAMMQFGQSNQQYQAPPYQQSMPGMSMYSPGMMKDRQSELMKFQNLVGNLGQKQPQNHFGQGGYPSYTQQDLSKSQQLSSFFPEMQTNHQQPPYPTQQNTQHTYQQAGFHQPAAPPTHQFSDPMAPPTNNFYPAPPAPSMPEQSEDYKQLESVDSIPMTNQHAQLQAYHQQPQYYPSQPQHMYPSSQGHGMQNSAMLRYLLFQSKDTASNSFLQILPYLMKNKQFANVIRLESLYVMVPDGCKCQRGGPNVPEPSTQSQSSFNPWSQYQQPFSQFSGFPSFQQGGHPSNPFSSFGSYPQSHQMGFGGFPFPSYNPFSQPASYSEKKKERNPKKKPNKNKDPKKTPESPKKST